MIFGVTPGKRKNSLDQWKHGDESSWGFCTGKRLALAWQLHVAPMATEEQGWELSSPPMGPSLLRGTGRVLLGLWQGPGEGFTSAFSECCHGLVVVEVSVVPYWKFIRGWQTVAVSFSSAITKRAGGGTVPPSCTERRLHC